MSSKIHRCYPLPRSISANAPIKFYLPDFKKPVCHSPFRARAKIPKWYPLRIRLGLNLDTNLKSCLPKLCHVTCPRLYHPYYTHRCRIWVFFLKTSAAFNIQSPNLIKPQKGAKYTKVKFHSQYFQQVAKSKFGKLDFLQDRQICAAKKLINPPGKNRNRHVNHISAIIDDPFANQLFLGRSN
jgi:hypothetical protein